MFNGTKSDISNKEPYCVPQGSVLDPLMFMRLKNYQSDAINCKIHLYTNGTVIIIAERSTKKLESKLNLELSKA